MILHNLIILIEGDRENVDTFEDSEDFEDSDLPRQAFPEREAAPLPQGSVISREEWDQFMESVREVFSDPEDEESRPGYQFRLAVMKALFGEIGDA